MKIGNVSGTFAPSTIAASAWAMSLIGFGVRSTPKEAKFAAPAETMHIRPL